MKFSRIALLFSATLALGACGTVQNGTSGIVNVTPAVFGTASPTVPADWRPLGAASGELGIAYGCQPDHCADPGLIAYQALRVAPVIEPEDSRIPVSAQVLAKVRAEVEQTSGGTVSQVSTRKLSKAGDVVEQSMVVTREHRAHVIVHVTRLPNEIHTIFAAGPTRAKARANMRIALDGLR